jgi:phage I-like protein
VASATRTAKSGRKTVRLTSAQVNVAKRLGVPISEYAKYVKEQ